MIVLFLPFEVYSQVLTGAGLFEQSCKYSADINLELDSIIIDVQTLSPYQFPNFREDDVLWLGEVRVINQGSCDLISPDITIWVESPSRQTSYPCTEWGIRINDTIPVGGEFIFSRDRTSERWYTYHSSLNTRSSCRGVTLDEIGKWKIDARMELSRPLNHNASSFSYGSSTYIHGSLNTDSFKVYSEDFFKTEQRANRAFYISISAIFITLLVSVYSIYQGHKDSLKRDKLFKKLYKFQEESLEESKEANEHLSQLNKSMEKLAKKPTKPKKKKQKRENAFSMFPIKVSDSDKIGRVYLKLKNSKGNNIDDYFEGVKKLQAFLRSKEFESNLTGFFLSFWNDGGIRFSYFTNNDHQTISFLDNKISSLGFTKYLDDVEPSDLSFGYYLRNVKTNLDFARFLQLITNIGLELLEKDVVYSRRLAVKYRLEIAPQGGSCKSYFEQAFNKMSYYKSLSPEIKQELMEGLDFWHTSWEDWAHMLIVMIMPGDWIYNNTLTHYFDPRRPLDKNIRNLLNGGLLPDVWDP